MTEIRRIGTKPRISIYESREKDDQVVVDLDDTGFLRFGYDGLYRSSSYKELGKIDGIDMI